MRFPAACYLLFAAPRKNPLDEMPEWVRRLVLAARDHAGGIAGRPVRLLGVSDRGCRLLDIETGDLVDPSMFRREGIHLLMNVGFLLSDTPPVQEMIRLAPEVRGVWSGLKAAGEVDAAAFCRKSWSPWGPAPTGMRLGRLLARLTATSEDERGATDAALLREFAYLPVSEACEENSPAMAGSERLTGRHSAYSPEFLNTAFREILGSTASFPGAFTDPVRMVQALSFHRDRSEVPWFFNTLINEIEFRSGAVAPESFPPEIHLSTFGRCNIECRFCGYTHDIARPHTVDPKQAAVMTWLRHAQTFRLASGLGEPTMNPHLPGIIRGTAARLPHLGMNFFTNGIALDRKGLIDALVGNVRWINVSLNAASAESYRAQCRTDGFARIRANLRALHAAKRARRTVQPLVFGSMVLNRANLHDLPKMPALCRELGVDRFTAFPYFALGKRDGEKFGPSMTLGRCRSEYDALFTETVAAAERHRVSLEIPPPSSAAVSRFGLEVRPLYDFARIETNQWTLGRFLRGLDFPHPEGAFCHFLWRYAAIGTTLEIGHSDRETHFLNPCIGPLSGVDLSRRTAFRFPDEAGFLALWRHPVMRLLREAQHREGICEVCDLCRQNDTRNPDLFQLLEKAVGRFAAEQREG